MIQLPYWSQGSVEFFVSPGSDKYSYTQLLCTFLGRWAGGVRASTIQARRVKVQYIVECSVPWNIMWLDLCRTRNAAGMQEHNSWKRPGGGAQLS